MSSQIKSLNGTDTLMKSFSTNSEALRVTSGILYAVIIIDSHGSALLLISILNVSDGEVSAG